MQICPKCKKQHRSEKYKQCRKCRAKDAAWRRQHNCRRPMTAAEYEAMQEAPEPPVYGDTNR